jgi:hypothetical protein
MMATLYSRPLEFSGNTKVVNLFNDRPETKFSTDVHTLRSLGIDASVPEHSLFLECYMKFLVNAFFCKEGKMDANSSIVSMPPRGTFPPRASVIKKFLGSLERSSLLNRAVRWSHLQETKTSASSQEEDFFRTTMCHQLYILCYANLPSAAVIRTQLFQCPLNFLCTYKTDCPPKTKSY